LPAGREGEASGRSFASGSGASGHLAGSASACVLLEVAEAASVWEMLRVRLLDADFFCLGICRSVADVPCSEMEDLLGSEIGKNDYDW
jgi:hypothetical protein